MKGWLRRFGDAYRLLGPALAWRALLHEVRPEYVYRAGSLRFELPVDDRVDVHPLRAEERARLVEVNPNMTAQVVERRQGLGEVCWVSWIGGEPAHYAWQTTEPLFLPYLGLTVEPQPDQVYVSDIYTSPRFRRSGVWVSSMAVRYRHDAAAGAAWAVALIAAWNATRMPQRSSYGWHDHGRLGYWHLGVGRRYYAQGRVDLHQPGRFRFRSPQSPQ